MKKFKLILSLVLVVATIFTTSGAVFAQDASYARINTNEVARGGKVTLMVHLANWEPKGESIPPLFAYTAYLYKDGKIVGRPIGKNVTEVNKYGDSKLNIQIPENAVSGKYEIYVSLWYAKDLEDNTFEFPLTVK